jgi:hypothetical protein
MLTVIGLALVIATWTIVKVITMNTPPDAHYTQAEAYAPMEAAAADAIAVLPDFPGFEKRSWSRVPCSRGGVDDPTYTNVEISYWFSIEDSGLDRVRSQYVDILREHWTSLGYEIIHEENRERPDGSTARGTAVKRDDDITLWYSASGYAVLIIQSGCVPVSDLDEFEYIPPAGGIEPGSEGDIVDRYFPDGIPTEDASADAIAPFEGTGAAANGLVGVIPWNLDDDDDARNRYDGLL